MGKYRLNQIYRLEVYVKNVQNICIHQKPVIRLLIKSIILVKLVLNMLKLINF